MKLYKLSLLALALAGTMAACSDDDYTMPVSTPGAFFPAEAPSVVELPLDGNSVDITVRRSDAKIASDETFQLKSTDASGLFTIPSSVTFVGYERTAQIHVTYDASKIEKDVEYPVTLSLDGALNAWGKSSYEFDFVLRTPLEITEYNNSVYTYNDVLFGPGSQEVNVEKQVNITTPDIETYVVKSWMTFGQERVPMDLSIVLHKNWKYGDDGYIVTVSHQALPQKVKINGVGEVTCEVEDMASYMCYLTGVSEDQVPNMDEELISYYETATGRFTINMAYTLRELDTPTDKGSYIGEGYEYLQLSGFPKYEVYLDYLGYFTNSDDELTAIGEFTTGEDVEEVMIVNIVGDDVATALEQIANGTLEGEMYDANGETPVRVQCAVPGAGDYTMIAVSYSKGEIVESDFVSYTIAGVEAGNWESIGEGIYVDGWVLPPYQLNDGSYVNPFDFPYLVEVEKNLDVDGEYRMVNPYSGNFPLADANKNTKKVNVVFNIADPDWPLVPFQSSGYDDGKRGMEWIAGFNWYAENVGGVSKDQVLANPNLAPLASYYESGVLEVTLPMFAQGADNKFSSNIADLKYNWKDEYPSQLTMPQGTKAATAAKAIRKAVSNNNFQRVANAAQIDVKFEKRNRRSNIGTFFGTMPVDAKIIRR